ncbi:MAG: hypothetical protein ACFBZ8_10180 [Opitutales bacterium]
MKAKSKGLFIELSEYAILAARTSSLQPPFTVETLVEFPAGLSEETGKELTQLTGLRKGGYVPVVSSAFPVNRFVRRASLDHPNKARDISYLNELLRSQFRIDPAANAVKVLESKTGRELDFNRTPSKEVLFAGAALDEWTSLQADLVANSLYPERLELGSLSILGGLANYLRFREDNRPVMSIELTADSAQVFILSSEGLDVSRPIPFGLRSMFPIVQEELGLKDEQSAEKLFYSDTFDFTEMAPVLLKKLLREVQASAGFYEVQTGQTISQLFLGHLPRSLSWIGSSFARSLAVEILQPVYEEWIEHLGIQVDPEVELGNRGSRWFGLFSMMGDFRPSDPVSQSVATHATANKEQG